MRRAVVFSFFALAGCGDAVVDEGSGGSYRPVPWTGGPGTDADEPVDEPIDEPDAPVDEPDVPVDEPIDDPVDEPVDEPVVDGDGWAPGWAGLEDQMLVLVNEMRRNGGDCPSGHYGPRPELVMNSTLRTAARLHSKDMADNNYFDHNSRNGDSPWDRMGAAGYDAQPVGENIAAGGATAASTFQQWVNSDGHCRNMMSQNSNEIGIGYANGPAQYVHYWTQTFGAR